LLLLLLLLFKGLPDKQPSNHTDIK